MNSSISETKEIWSLIFYCQILQQLLKLKKESVVYDILNDAIVTPLSEIIVAIFLLNLISIPD